MHDGADTPRIAILVACHDDGATLEETIESLRREPDTELVLVDDGSTDAATLERLDRLERGGLRVLRQQNAGPSAAWTTGLQATRARYVLPFSSDDVLLPGAARLLADELDADPGAAVAWGDMQTFGLASAYRPSVPVLCPWQISFTNCIPPYSLFRRDALLASGGWEVISASEDWDLWMRMAALGQRGVHVAQPVYAYRRGRGGRFRRRGNRYEPFYDELRTRNAGLFDARAANRRASVAPWTLKMLLPLVEALPGVPRLKKMQLCEALTLLLWSGGPRRTARIVLEGLRFRLRLRRGRS
jgi:glycosyltransferase involved in cell wall biosynthesis